MLLQGCALVVVKSEGAQPHLSAYPLGVRVERGEADAVGVKQWNLGLWWTGFAGGLGVSSSKSVVIDAHACTGTIIDGPASPAAKGLLNKIVKQADFECLGQKEDPK